MGGVAENSLEFGLMNQTAAMCNHMISQLLQKAAKSAPLGVDDLAWLQLLKIQAIELRGQLLEKYLKEYRLRKKSSIRRLLAPGPDQGQGYRCGITGRPGPINQPPAS
jgi:hypothetical protein